MGPHQIFLWRTEAVEAQDLGTWMDHFATEPYEWTYTGRSYPMNAKAKLESPRAPLNFLGLACAIGVSTIYFNQPLLVDMGRTYGEPAGRVMFVSGATQVGYALGLLLFVPLGDVLERRARSG